MLTKEKLTYNNRYVSFPRTGHYIINTLIMKYFDLDPAVNYCEFYSCCQQFPCAQKREVFIHKSHDFDLNLPVISEHKTVVGIRHPFDSIISWYYLSEIKEKGCAVSEEKFFDFFYSKLEFYSSFVKKWLVAHENIHIYEYARFFENFGEEFSKLISFLLPEGSEIETDRIREIENNFNLVHRPERDGFISSLSFDKEFYSNIDNLSELLNSRLGYTPKSRYLSSTEASL